MNCTSILMPLSNHHYRVPEVRFIFGYGELSIDVKNAFDTYILCTDDYNFKFDLFARYYQNTFEDWEYKIVERFIQLTNWEIRQPTSFDEYGRDIPDVNKPIDEARVFKIALLQIIMELNQVFGFPTDLILALFCFYYQVHDKTIEISDSQLRDIRSFRYEYRSPNSSFEYNQFNGERI